MAYFTYPNIRMAIIKTRNIVGENVGKLEPSYTVGGNVNWYRHYHGRKRFLLKLKRELVYHMIQQLYGWASIQKN